MMFAEPGIVDANVLVYAVNADVPQHAAARALLDTAREGSVSLFVTPQILCEFYSVVTNPRRVASPCSPSEASAAISDLITFIHVLPVPGQTVQGLLSLLRRHPMTGGDVFDRQIVAAMQANELQRIYTFNTADFGGFPELAVIRA